MTRLSFKLALLPALLLALSASLLAQEYSFRQYPHFSNDFASNPCKPFIGVGTSNVPGGLHVDYTVENTPATQYGVQTGDVILALDGVAVGTQSELLRERDKHQQGDAFTLTLIRNGRQQTINARFKSCSEAEQKEAIDRIMNATLLTDFFYQQVERDPCKMFIGVYTSTNAVNGGGTRVNGVIDGTPAQEAGIQQGDVIMALNGQPVNTYDELTRERNKNKPGDAFRLTVSRNGVMMEVKARFKSCDQKQTEVAPDPVEQREAPKDVDNSLKMEVLEAFPNPTYGLVNVHFEAEAVPTTVQITDISGKVVYSKNLPKFDGSFNEPVNLSNQNAGNYVLSIRQGDKLRSKQIVLLPRA